MNIQTESGLKEALSYLEQGNTEQTYSIIAPLFENDLESTELIYTTKICRFWSGTLRSLSTMSDPFERGETLLTEWNVFVAEMQKYVEYLPAFYAIQKGIFTIALENYLKLLDKATGKIKAEVFRKAGMCYKKLGSFENACRCLSEANSADSGQAAILAELADCFSLCGNDKNAKLLFREAFFKNPEQIDIEFLDSGLIKSLIEKLKEKLNLNMQNSANRKILNEWIPVYGVLWGIFNIKREMTSQEITKLKKDIYSMEIENKKPSAENDILTPRLLKSYFWLIDQYVTNQNMNAQVNEVLLKIKVLDPNIYNLYIS